MAQLIIIMGVSGTGKSTIGELLSEKLQLPYHDADDFHPEANVQKMQQGNPLNDQDREPWLQLLSDKLEGWSDTGTILACSALKEKYRRTLSKSNQLPIKWVHLVGSFEVIRERMLTRKNHYMPESLLQSQFDALENPTNAIDVNIENTPKEMVAEILAKL
ncbi:MAG: gluconokinase [Cytophagales bacterium]|nr:gluconokinase [Cytophagales bacterium]